MVMAALFLACNLALIFVIVVFMNKFSELADFYYNQDLYKTQLAVTDILYTLGSHQQQPGTIFQLLASISQQLHEIKMSINEAKLTTVKMPRN